jgi:ATP-dependent DNA helicase 2 subunit 2
MIVGLTAPLEDFRANLKVGDLVSKAVADMAVVILDVIEKPFGGRRAAEMIECMKAMREVCVLEDEVDAWNQL